MHEIPESYAARAELVLDSLTKASVLVELLAEQLVCHRYTPVIRIGRNQSSALA